MMKNAKSLVILAVLASVTALAPLAGAQEKKPAAPASNAAAPQAAKAPKTSPAIKKAAVTAKAPRTRPATASVAKASKAKPAKAAASKTPKARPATPAVAQATPAAAPQKVEPLISRRDPFSPLVAVAVGGGETTEHLPPGKAGLVVATVRVDGAVAAPSGMIAVVSNPQDRVYFIRVGDRLYDGDVEKISLDGVTFKENSKDAFGKSVERLVTKRIYPNAGEQQ